MKDKKSLKNLMRREGREGREVAVTPRVVHSARSHQTVTDTERLQERNFFCIMAVRLPLTLVYGYK